MLVAGVVLIAIFLLWERYLELSPSFSPSSLSARYPSLHPSPLIKPTIFLLARGRFSAVLLIALLEWMCFLSWNFWLQLYYQNWLGLRPVGSMERMLPMFVTGLVANGVVAGVVGRVRMVVLIGARLNITKEQKKNKLTKM
jgi:hypothetical protein